MPYYEVVYETGRMSVANYEDDAEAQKALGEHNSRAMKGEAGGPIGQPAERVAAVYVYDSHPNDYNDEQTMSADVASKTVSELINETKDKNGVINLDALAVGVRGISHPMSDAEGFESRYKMKEKKKLALNFGEGK